MPEGDTIWRTARTLDAALAGKVVTAVVSPLPAVAAAARRLRVVGQPIARVEARGKHLLVAFAGGAVLHTHQRMHGSWHLYRRGSPWCLPAHHARAVIETAEAVAVCFQSPVVEMLSPAEAASHPALVRLGPDLLKDDFDPAAARRRLRERGEIEIGVALMDQTAVAGIGNVYKSEVLFLCGVWPRARVRDLDDQALERLLAVAREQMRRNLGPGYRRTTTSLSPEKVWVYRREGEPCRRCGTLVRRVVQGEQARSTYFCPTCQPNLDRPPAGARPGA